MRVADEYAAALNAKGEPTGKRRPFLERVKDRIHLRMEGQAHPTYHECFLDHTLLSRPLYPPHHPHLVALRQELESWLSFYFEPRERMRATNPVKEVHHIGLRGEELAAFLNTLRALNERQFRAVEKALHMVIPSITGIDVEVNSLGEVELRLREGKTLIPARVVSEGTLRILGLLALAGATEAAGPDRAGGTRERRSPATASTHRRAASDASRTGGNADDRDHPLPAPGGPDPRAFLYVCRKREGGTQIEPFTSLPLWRSKEVSQALEDASGRRSPRRPRWRCRLA